MAGKTVVLITLFAAAVVSYPATSSLLQDISLKILAMREEVGLFWLIFIAIAYAFLLAIPFVPGIELGLLITVLFGASGAIIAHSRTCSSRRTGARQVLVLLELDETSVGVRDQHGQTQSATATVTINRET